MSLKYEPASELLHIHGGLPGYPREVGAILSIVTAVGTAGGPVRRVARAVQPGEGRCYRKVDVRLSGKGNSNSHGAWPVHLIISMIKWIRASRLSIKNSLYRRWTGLQSYRSGTTWGSRTRSRSAARGTSSSRSRFGP